MARSATVLAPAAALVTCAVTAVAAGAPMVERPPAGHTGGFGEPTCLTCHMGNGVNAFGGSVSLEGLPDAYRPGEEYLVTVRLRADETVTAGFQLTARRSGERGAGRDAGHVEPVDDRTAVTDSASVRYVHQSPEGSAAPDPSGSSWALVWRAPPEGGPVVFHVAANSGNGDASPLGDLVYTSELHLTELPGG